MATFLGKDGAVYLGAEAEEVAEVRDFSLETSSEVVNTTKMGDTWMTNKATQKSWSATITCYYDSTDTNGQLDIDEGDDIRVNLYPEGKTSTKKYYYGNVIVTGITRSASFDGLVEITFTGTGNGELYEAASA
jgi:hypothetical protein